MLDLTTMGMFLFSLFVAFFVEKLYVSKIGIIPNIAIIVPQFYASWNLLPDIFRYWLLFGIGFGILGIISYWKSFSIGPLHEINYLLYSLKTILGLYISILFLGFNIISLVSGIIVSICLWYIGINYFNNKIPFGD